MNTKERFLLYWKEHKGEAIAWLVGLLVFMAGSFAGGVAIEETNPETVTLLRGARVTEVARVTPTTAQGRATVSPTVTKPAPTMTPTVTTTPLPGVTNTPVATVTPLPFPTLTPTSIIVGHDVTTWHAPGVAGHHHGEQWQNAHPEIVKWLTQNEYGALFTSIGNVWTSSPIENLFPWPLGKHEGHLNLVENDTHCDQFKQNDAGLNCIKAYYFQPHVLGNAMEVRTQIHSHKLVALVCDYATQSICDIVATGGWVDYGEFHSQYKKTFCPQPNRPQYPSGLTTNQPPYVAIAGSDRKTAFWSSSTNPVIEKYFNPVPNQLLEVSWNNRPFSMPSLEDCTDPSLDLVFNDKDSRNNIFQVFNIKLLIANLPRPFVGFTDRYGNVVGDCAVVSLDCIPLYIGAKVPVGDALLNRNTAHGDPEAAPLLIYGDDDTLLLPPGDTTP